MDLTAAYDAVWHTGLYYKVSKTTSHSFMDLTAAYDTVWHTSLYYKVSKTTPHSFTRLVELLLRNSHFRVHMDDICFLLGSYVDWRKFRTSLHIKFTGKDQDKGHFLES